MNMQIFYASLFFCLILGFLAAGSLLLIYHRYLRSRHPGTWRELGSPSSLFGAPMTRAARSFLWRGGHKQLNDGQLDRLAVRVKLTTLATWLLILVAFATFLIDAALR
jgi:hypothetical protein